MKSFKQWLENRCWKGYEPTPGKKPYSKKSCRKKLRETTFTQWLTESQNMKEQKDEFWDSVRHKLGNNKNAKNAIAHQDLRLLLKLFKGKEDHLAQYAQEKGLPLIALQIRQLTGVIPDSGFWMSGKKRNF